MDAVFAALANGSRRLMLDIVRNDPGCSVNDVCAHFDMSRIAVMKHLRILEAARLIISEKRGRSRQLYFNAVPIQMIYDRWTTEYSALWASGLTALKYAVESGGAASRSSSAKAGKKKEKTAARSSKSSAKSGRKTTKSRRASKGRKRT